MSDVSFRATLPETVAPAPPPRPRLLTIGTALTSAAVIVGFGALLSLYVRTRAVWIQGDNGPWLPRGVVIPLTQPNMMAITFVFSLISMAWAVASLRNDDRPNAYIALGLTILFGIANIAQTAYLLTIMEMPIAGEAAARPPLFYAVIGVHMIITIAAIGYVAVMGIRTLGGSVQQRDLEGLYGAALFWFTTVATYFAMWYAIYITK